MEHLKASFPIHTDRLLIRFVEAGDWKDIQQIWKDFATSPYVQYDMPHNTDEEDVRLRIARWAAVNTSENLDHLFFAVCLKDTVIGYAAFNKRELGYELGYAFSAAGQGKGYAKESISAILRHLGQHGITELSVRTAINNTPSIRLISALEFQQIGTEQVSFYKNEKGEDIYFEGGIFQR